MTVCEYGVGPDEAMRNCGRPAAAEIAASLQGGPYRDFGVCRDHVGDLVEDLRVSGFTVLGDWD